MRFFVKYPKGTDYYSWIFRFDIWKFNFEVAKVA